MEWSGVALSGEKRGGENRVREGGRKGERKGGEGKRGREVGREKRRGFTESRR